MVGDGYSTDDIRLPLVFLFSREGAVLTAALEEHQNVDVLLLPKERQLGRGEDRRPAHAQMVVVSSVLGGFLDVPPCYFPDNVEKSVGMNIKLRLAKEEVGVEGPTLEFLLSEGEALVKEEELREEQQRFCAESSGTDPNELCSTTASSQSLSSDAGLLPAP